MASRKQYIRLILSFLAAGIFLVICYSPGFLGLRPSDPSILRAGCSILAVPAAVSIILPACLAFLKGPGGRDPEGPGKNLTEKQAREIFSMYTGNRYFGKTARAALEQVQRTAQAENRLEEAVKKRFGASSMAAQRLLSASDRACGQILENLTAMAGRMRLFDTKEYARLEHYREDDIPDDIQEEQIRVYKKNLDAMKEAAAANERTLLRLDAMALDLYGLSGEHSDGSSILAELETLTNELKYYS